MTSKLTPSTVLLLTVPPLLWASNAVVGRLVHELVPPMTLNLLRWAIAMIILLPLAGFIFRPGSSLWPYWRRFALLGLLGIGLYNSLQYLALQTSTPINVTLVASGMPVWMLLVGWMFFDTRIARKQVVGAILSITGVLVVLSRGEWEQLLALRLVPGDVFMILATIIWAFYSWLLAISKDPQDIRSNWVAFLLAQMAFGVVWSSALTTGEWVITDARIYWGWPLAAAVLYVAIGPAIIAYGCWGAGVRRAGPNIAGFFNNLTPIFAALMSSAFLGEMPQLYHGAAFALIVGGIAYSSRR